MQYEHLLGEIRVYIPLYIERPITNIAYGVVAGKQNKLAVDIYCIIASISSASC